MLYNQSMSSNFSIRDTNICKGIAIVFMVFHHIVGKFYNTFDLSWYSANCSGSLLSYLLLFVSSAGKVCVSLLTILAGYGIYKKYINYRNASKKVSEIKFVLSRYIKLYSITIPLYAVFVVVRYMKDWASLKDLILFYNKNADVTSAIARMLIDIFGLSGVFKTPSLIGNWYITAVLILYLLFPIIRELTVRFKFVFVLLCNLPWIYLMIQGGFKENVFYCYLSEFSLGIWFAQSGILDKLKNNISKRKSLVSSLFLIVAWVLRIVFALPMDILFAVSLILFEINVISNTTILSKILSLYGTYSSDIWLIHLIANGAVVMFIQYKPLQGLLVLLCSLVMSIIIEFIKKLCKVDVIVKKIEHSLLVS